MTGSRPESARRRAGKPGAGVTLIEVMAAIIILAIAVIGASGYRYYSALDAKRAEMQSAAARVALLLCENWRGLGYDRTGSYDPVTHLNSQMQIETASAGPSYPSGFTPLGRYQVVADNVRYLASLSWNDDASVPGLRALNVVVSWAQRQVDSDGNDEMDKTYSLTTYVSS